MPKDADLHFLEKRAQRNRIALRARFQSVTLNLALGADPAEAADYLAGTGPGRAILDAVPEDQRPTALDAVRAVLDDHTQPDGVRLGASIWIITAGNPT